MHLTIRTSATRSTTTLGAVASVLTALLLGCGMSDAGTPVGVWEIDADAMKDAWNADRDDSEQAGGPGLAQMALAMIESSSGTISLHEDGTATLDLSLMGESLAATGTWSADGHAIAIRYEEAGGTESLNGELDGRRLRFESLHGEPGLVLRKRSGSATSAAGTSRRDPPPLGPLRRGCRAAVAESGRQRPVDDIVGLRPGMGYDDVLEVLECRQDIRLVQHAELWSTSENFGIPTRQLVRATDGVPCDGEYSPKPAGAQNDCDTGADRFEPLRNISQEYLVAFTGMPEEETARAIWRRTIYSEDDAQPVTLLTEALHAKYGTPQLHATGSHSRLNHTRPGAINLVWIYHPNGTPAPPPTSEFSSAGLAWETCVNGPQPWFATQQRWNSGCGLTVRAEILPLEGNSLLAREMNIMIMNQRDLYHGNQQFQHALKVVSDERLRASGTRPDL